MSTVRLEPYPVFVDIELESLQIHRIRHCCHGGIVHCSMCSTMSPLTNLDISEQGSMPRANLDHEVVKGISVREDDWLTVEDSDSFVVNGAR